MISSASYKIFSDQGRYCVAVLLYETPSSYLRVHRDTIPISYNLLDQQLPTKFFHIDMAELKTPHYNSRYYWLL